MSWGAKLHEAFILTPTCLSAREVPLKKMHPSMVTSIPRASGAYSREVFAVIKRSDAAVQSVLMYG